MNNELSSKEKAILVILTRSRRSMTPQQITDELKSKKINISRPTVAKYLNKLKEKEYIKED